MLKLKARTNNIAKATKIRFNSLLQWIKSSRKHQLIVFVVALLFLVAGAVAINTKADKSVEVVSISSEKSKELKTLRIESNIPGINVKGDPYCDSAELNKVTPYDCELKEGQNETVITAPAEATLEGKTYIFQTWDGCSAGNDDWKICFVKMDGVSSKNIIATYKEKLTVNKQPTKQTEIPTPNPNKAPTCVDKEEVDSSFASCLFEFTDTPANIVIELKTYATECGKYMQNYGMSLYHYAPCEIEYAQDHFMLVLDDSSKVICDISSACSIGIDQAGLSYHKKVIVSSPTAVKIKIPLKQDLLIRCRFTCKLDSTFSEWRYLYDTNSKTFRLKAYHQFSPVDIN